MIKKSEKGNEITFEDGRRFAQEDYREYEFYNIKMLRPSDEFL